MRWNKPKDGEIVVHTNFAYFPTTLCDNTKIWFETYCSVVMYSNNRWHETIYFDKLTKLDQNDIKYGLLNKNFTTSYVQQYSSKIIESAKNFLDKEFYEVVDNIVNDKKH